MMETNNVQPTCIHQLQQERTEYFAPVAGFKSSTIARTIEEAIYCAAFRTVDNECHKKFFDTLIPELESAVLDPLSSITEEEKETIMKLILVERSDEFVDTMLSDIVKGSEKYANRVQH